MKIRKPKKAFPTENKNNFPAPKIQPPSKRTVSHELRHTKTKEGPTHRGNTTDTEAPPCSWRSPRQLAAGPTLPSKTSRLPTFYSPSLSNMYFYLCRTRPTCYKRCNRDVSDIIVISLLLVVCRFRTLGRWRLCSKLGGLLLVCLCPSLLIQPLYLVLARFGHGEL